MSDSYTPKPGSLAERAVEFFKRNPTEELTRRDFADKFDCAQTSVDNGLVAAVSHGYIATANNDEMVRVWVAGPALKGSADPVPVFRTRRPAQPRKPRVPTTPIDPDTIQIEPGISKPPLRYGQGSQYTVIIKRMQPGDSVQLPIAHAKRLCDWAKKRAKGAAADQRWSLRTLDAENARVWRDA